VAIGTIDSFAESLKARGLSPHTVKAFVTDVRQFLEFLAGRPPSTELAAQWLAGLHEAGLTNKTCARKRTALAAYARFAGLQLELPKIRPEQRLPEALSEVEAKAVLEAARQTRNGERDRLMVELMLRTGLRAAELLALTPLDLVEDGDILFIRVRQGKGNKERRVPVINKALVRQLQKYAKAISPGERLFPMSSRNLRKLVARIGQKAGLSKRLYPHLLRHTAATLYLRKGANIETVRRTLGHASLATTQKYLALTDEDVARDLARAEW